jgi:hypothetical protein
LSNFELALQPGIGREEGERLLHVVIVGGGPTGVEFGAELYDFIEQVQKKGKHNETCPIWTPFGQAKSVTHSEVSSLQGAICTEKSNL